MAEISKNAKKTASGSAPIERSFMITFSGSKWILNRPLGIYSQNQNSLGSDNVALSKIFQKLKISEEKKSQKMRFCAFSRQPVGGFSKKFFCLKGLPKTHKKVVHTCVAATHRLAAIPKFRLFRVQSDPPLIVNPIFSSWLG